MDGSEVSVPEGSILNNIPVESKKASPWAIRVLGGVGTSTNVTRALTGTARRVPGTWVGSVELSYRIKEGLWGLPIDVSLAAAEMLHTSTRKPPTAWQTNAYVKFEWTSFPWNEHLRTRAGIAEGLSYVTKITYSEQQRHPGEGSKRFLNYLDFSLSLNLADLNRVVKTEYLIGDRSAAWNDTWFVMNLSHRSGAWGTFGKTRDKLGDQHDIAGADNIIMMGVSHRF